jgi:hypothetical protein
MLNLLVGKRTYILALAAVLTAFGGFLNGDLTLSQFIQDAIMGAGLGTLRAAVR